MESPFGVQFAFEIRHGVYNPAQRLDRQQKSGGM
jgi:hypothetical protein